MRCSALLGGVRAVCLIGLLVVCPGCGKGGKNGGTTSIILIKISPLTAVLAPSATQRFKAEVTGASNQRVAWSCTEGSIDANGLYTAPTAPGKYKVTATSEADSSKRAEATVTVTADPAGALQVDPSEVALNVGGTTTFAALQDGAEQAVTWTVAEGDAGGTIDANGAYTAPGTAGTYHVVATSQADPEVVATATVTVEASPPPRTLEVSPREVTLEVLGTTTFAASLDGAEHAVTWSLADGAGGGAVETDGRYTAPGRPGTYQVVATSQADPAVVGAATVTVADSGVTVADGVRVIRDDGSVTLGAVTDTTVELNGRVGSYQPGDILTSSLGPGLMRRVLSVEQTSSGVRLTTEPAALTEVFERATLNNQHPLGAGDFSSDGVLLDGVSLGAGSSSRQLPGITLQFDKTLLDDSGITVIGQIDLSVQFNTRIEIDGFSLLEAQFAAVVDSQASLNITAKGKVELDKSWTVYKAKGKPFLVFLGTVPVWFTPEMQLDLAISGSLKAELVVRPSMGFHAEYGAQYAKGSGWRKIDNLKTFTYPGWGGIKDGVPPHANVECTVHADVLKPKFVLWVEGVAGPYFEAAAFAEVTFNYEQSGQVGLLHGQAKLGLTAEVGVTAEFLGVEILDYATDGLLHKDWTVWEDYWGAVGDAEISISRSGRRAPPRNGRAERSAGRGD